MTLKGLYNVFVATVVPNGITAFIPAYSSVFSAFVFSILLHRVVFSEQVGDVLADGLSGLVLPPGYPLMEFQGDLSAEVLLGHVLSSPFR